MSTITASTASNNGQFRFSRLLWVGPLAGVVAAIGNLLVFFIAKGVGVPFVMPLNGPGSTPEPLPFFAVIVASLVPAIGAAIFLAILAKFTSRASLIFLVISVLFLLVSFGGPFSLPVDLGTQLALSLMHVVAGVVTVGMLTTLGRGR
jgi:hypothetical protein